MQAFRPGMFALLGWLAASSVLADDLEVYFSGGEDCSCLVILDSDAIGAGISTIDQQAAAHGADPAWLVNADTPTEAANPPLRWNELFPGDEVVLPAGRIGDEGFFSPPPPPVIRYADGTTSSLAYEDWINAYVAGTLTQEQLDQVRDVAPLRNADLSQLVGRKCIGVVHNGDVQINSSTSDPLSANLQGTRNGLFTFTILEVLEPGSIPESQSTDSLNDLRVRVEAPGSLATGGSTDPYNTVTEPNSPDSSGSANAATLVPVLSVNTNNRLYNNNDLYVAMSELGAGGWIGNVKRYRICDGSGGCTPGEILDADDTPAMDEEGNILDTARSVWSDTVDGPVVSQGGAGAQVPASADRRLVTYTGSEDIPATPVVLDPDSGEHAISTANVAILAPKLQLSGAKLNAVRDEFTTASFANNDGTMNWSSDWVVTGDTDVSATAGLIQVSGGQLRLQSDSGSNQIWREVDLSAASAATLSFDYDNQLTDGPGRIRLEVSGDGGATWRSLTEFTSASTRSGSPSFDISAEIAANTRIRFVYVALDAGGRLAIDNVQIATDGTTLRDEFNTVSYSNNDGTMNWSGDWVETGDTKGAAGDNVKVSGGLLEIKVDSYHDIYREANLAGASSPQLRFDFTHNLNELDELIAEVSNDAGVSYTVLETFTAATPQTGSRSYDLQAALGSVSANTRVRFRVGPPSSGGEKFKLDMIEIQHNGSNQSATNNVTTENLVNWIRGQDIKDEDGDGDTTEDRAWSFASPQHSRPLVVSYGTAVSKDGTGAPIEKMLLGTSDGGLRMINAATGVEEFVFYVPSMLEDQPDLMALADSASTLGMDLSHAYGVDGSPSAKVVDNDGDGQIEPGDGDQVHVYVGLRRGGTEMYALDVSPDDAAGLNDETAANGITPKFLWRLRGGSGAFAALGQTWSTPQATRIAMGTATAGVRAAQSVLIFGGGYDVSQDNGFGPAPTGNAVFIVDPKNASKILSIGGPGSGADLELPGMDYPIPGDITLMDANGDAVTDRLYFADTGGQVWRVDLDPNLTAGNPGRTAGARLAVLADQSATAAPADQRRFYHPPEVTRISDMDRYAHVRDYDVITITSGYVAHPLDTSVHDRVYAIRDYLIDSPIRLDASGAPSNYPQCAADGTVDTCGGSITEINLYDATENLIQDGDESQIAAAELSLKNSEGWYVVLRESFSSGSGFIGEKGMSKTVVLDGILFFTTYIPPQQSCGDDIGYSRLWAVELLNGAAVFADFDGNTSQLTRTDRARSLGPGLPGQPVPMFIPSGLRIVVGAGDQMIGFDPGIATPVRRSYWYEER